MTRRRAEVLAWGLWGVAVVTMVGSAIAQDVISPGSISVDTQIAGLPMLLFATVGAIVASRRPENRIGWLYLAIGVLAGFTSIGGVLEVVHYPAAGPGRFLLALFYALTNLAWYPTLGLLATLPVLWFPDGRPPTPRWRWVEVLAFVGIIGGTLSFASTPGPLNGPGTPVNPIGIGGVDGILGAAQAVFNAAFVVSIAGSVASFVVRFRRSKGVERLQLRWFLVGAIVFGLGILASIFFNPSGDLLFALTTSALPVAAGIAITRYRLYDLDRLISRAVAYLAVSALLVGVYAALVVGVGALTGGSDNPLLIAGATLAVAALVRPVLRRVKSAVDRRFARRRYDAQLALEAFAARLRDEIALEQVRGHLLATVGETVQPATTSLWLRGDRR